jgi:hypothetical protein
MGVYIFKAKSVCEIEETFDANHILTVELLS